MRCLFVASTFALLATQAAAAEWVGIAESDRNSYSVLGGSLNVTTNRSGEEVVVVTGKDYDKGTNSVTLEKWYISTQHCSQGQGKAVVVNMDGQFKYQYDFIFGAGSVGSTKAEAICSAYQYRMKQTSGKGL